MFAKQAANNKQIQKEIEKLVGRPLDFSNGYEGQLDIRELALIQEAMPDILASIHGGDANTIKKKMFAEKRKMVKEEYATGWSDAMRDALTKPGCMRGFLDGLKSRPFKYGLCILDILSSINLQMTQNSEAPFANMMADSGAISCLMTLMEANQKKDIGQENRIYLAFYTMVLSRAIITNFDPRHAERLLPESDRELIVTKVTNLLSHTTMFLLKYEAIRLLSTVLVLQAKRQEADSPRPAWLRTAACLVNNTCAELLKCNALVVRGDMNKSGSAITTLLGRMTWSNAEVAHMAHPISVAVRRTAADVALGISGGVMKLGHTGIDYDCTLLWGELVSTLLEAKDILTDLAASLALKNLAEQLTRGTSALTVTEIFGQSLMGALERATDPAVRLNIATVVVILARKCKDLSEGLTAADRALLLSVATSTEKGVFAVPKKTIAAFMDSVVATPYVVIDRQCGEVYSKMHSAIFATKTEADVWDRRALLQELISSPCSVPAGCALADVKGYTAAAPRTAVPDTDPSVKSRVKQQRRAATEFKYECSCAMIPGIPKRNNCSGCVARIAAEKGLGDVTVAEVCSNCSAKPDGKIKKCSGCLCVGYCSADCQKAHWKAGHKTQCKVFAAAALS